VLLYDTFHDLSDPDGVLTELHRVLKPNGILSFSDHHMKKNEITSRVTERGLFKLSKEGKRTFIFLKEERD
jgi:ubiquinone/menaquinone biosynthesis C-methylase UbiE